MTASRRNPVVIIGAGIGGLSAAVHLAARDIPVLMLEKHHQVGGKMGESNAHGYHWDTGPSLITMRHVFEDLFRSAGRRLTDFVNLIPLDPMTRYFYPDGFVLDATNRLPHMLEQIEKLDPLDVEGYLNFLAYAARIYRIAGPVFIHDLPPTIAHLKRVPIGDYLKIDPLRSMHAAIEQYVRSPHLRQLLARFGTYVGADPYQAPATLNVIAHVELNGGAWYPRGGVHEIARALRRLATELGVEIKTGCEAKEIQVEDRQVIGVRIAQGDTIFTNTVIANVDIVQVYKSLLASAAISARKLKRMLSAEKSCSGFIMLAGVNKVHRELAHHNVFFSGDYRREFDQIFRQRLPPEEPTIYVSVTSKTDPDHAPTGCENWFILVNSPPTSDQFHWAQQRERYADLILARLSQKGIDIRNSVEHLETITPQDLSSLTGAYRGALYGMSSNHRLAAFLRPRNRDSDIRGLYYAGGTVHPGGGVPMVMLSGKVAAKYVLEDLGSLDQPKPGRTSR